MTWMLKDPGGVEIKESPIPPNGFENAVRLARRVVVTFVQVDETGVATGAKPHVYDEPYVHDLSPAGIAKKIRDQQDQLNAIEQTKVGVLSADDLATIKALVTPPAPEPPTEEEQAAIDKRNAVGEKLREQRKFLTAVSLGLLKPDDGDVVAAQDAVKQALEDDPSLVLDQLA